MSKITLYQFELCPYCEKVRQKLKEKNIEYKKVEVPHDRDDPIRKELLEKSGVQTVPVIQIEDKYMGESSDIINYLEANF
tara:strand:- start:340 stop:579 length:240 start_codon:yes stop_codon:yes gene_type:complete